MYMVGDFLSFGISYKRGRKGRGLSMLVLNCGKREGETGAVVSVLTSSGGVGEKRQGGGSSTGSCRETRDHHLQV